MANFKIDWTDFNEKTQKFVNLTIPQVSGVILNALADDAVRNAKDICPVRTGNLKSTIRKEPNQADRESIYVSAGGVTGAGSPPWFVNYAAAVHEGHHTRNGGWVAPNSFLRIGAERAVREMGYGKVASIDITNFSGIAAAMYNMFG